MKRAEKNWIDASYFNVQRHRALNGVWACRNSTTAERSPWQPSPWRRRRCVHICNLTAVASGLENNAVWSEWQFRRLKIAYILRALMSPIRRSLYKVHYICTLLYTVSQKCSDLYSLCNFVKSWLIFQILAPRQSVWNLLQMCSLPSRSSVLF